MSATAPFPSKHGNNESCCLLPAPSPMLMSDISSTSTISHQGSTITAASSKFSESSTVVDLNLCLSKDISVDSNDDEELHDDLVPPSLVRHLSSCSHLSSRSVKSSKKEVTSHCCPICLDPMSPIDHQHPLQCPTRNCQFNMCTSCINSLLSSSKDDFKMASDGNMHVKIYLNCPNCRANLSTTIRDVLLLRKVDTVQWLMAEQQELCCNEGGEREAIVLNASQERTRQAMEKLHVQEAIQQAREKEDAFWKMLVNNDDDDDDDDTFGEHKEDDRSMQSTLSRASRWSRDGSLAGDEEWGVEADLDSGVHSSFRMPGGGGRGGQRFSGSCASLYEKKEDKPDSNDGRKKPLDETLLQGLEGVMLYAEKLDVTHWMTSGNPDDLARAAQTLKQLEEDIRQGIKPADRQKALNRKATLFEIVEETRQLQIKETKPSSGGGIVSPRQRQAFLQKQRGAENREWEIAMAAKSATLERYPLPVRMPKVVTLDLWYNPTDRWFPVRFCDDNWDGTVVDAYTKLNVAAASSRRRSSGRTPSQPWTVTKKPQSNHPGVFNILSQGQYQNHFGQVELTMDQPARVLIASVKGPAGRQGVMKGDVLTHIDGEAVVGKTVEDLVSLLLAQKQAGKKSIQMTLNADASIAEALKRRAKVMDM